MKNILYLYGAGCGGCGGDTISLLNAEKPDFVTAIKSMGLNFAWHPSLS
jgi:Ni,Fe-hydrogenase I small subunit